MALWSRLTDNEKRPMTLEEAASKLLEKEKPIHATNRLFEWMMSGMMLGIAFTLALPQDTLAQGPLHILVVYGVTDNLLTLFFGLTGLFRCVALYLNGKMPVWGPRIRAIGAMGAALIWAQLAVILLVSTKELGYTSIGVPVYSFLVLGEFISIYRATFDAGVRGY
jgi:hypothetical protein